MNAEICKTREDNRRKHLKTRTQGGLIVWTVVYIAPGADEAKKIEEILRKEGFLVKLRPVGLSPGCNINSVEILVPESEVQDALEIINGL